MHEDPELSGSFNRSLGYIRHIKNVRMGSGKIILYRKDKTFGSGFAVTRLGVADLLQQLPVLHPREMEYFNTLSYDRRKASYLLGRVAAKKAMAEIVNDIEPSSIFIDRGIFEFPVVKGAGLNIQVSISHCEDIGVALAFPEEHPLGIDIEKVSEDKVEAMKSQITGAELGLIAAQKIPLTVGCTLLWTVKEGLSKILKTGFTLDLRIFEIRSIEQEGLCYCSYFANCIQYKALSFQADTYICTIVLPKNTTTQFGLFQSCFHHAVSDMKTGENALGTNC